VLRGAGDTRYPMFVLFGCAALVFLPGVWLLGHHLGLGIIGAWAAALVHVFAVAVGQTVRFLRGRWAEAAPDAPA
jgi:Na+-driven multidrug efflux pump